MKFTLLVVLTVVIAVSAVPPYEESAKFNSIELEAEQKISELVDNLSNLKSGGMEKMMLTMLANSLDKNCMLAQYRKFGLLGMLTNNTNEIDDGENSNEMFKNQETRVEEEVEKLVLNSVFAMCSNKNYVILEFIIENWWTHKILLNAFINEPEMKEYKNMLTCANNYAVKNGIIDPKFYQIKHELSEDIDEQCDEWVAIVKQQIFDFKMETRRATSRRCSLKIVDSVEKFLVKNILLLQVDLTEAQKRKEKKHFNRDFNQILESILECAAREPIRKKI